MRREFENVRDVLRRIPDDQVGRRAVPSRGQDVVSLFGQSRNLRRAGDLRGETSLRTSLPRLLRRDLFRSFRLPQNGVLRNIEATLGFFQTVRRAPGDVVDVHRQLRPARCRHRQRSCKTRQAIHSTPPPLEDTPDRGAKRAAWRTHSCVLRRHFCRRLCWRRRGVAKSRDTARKSACATKRR